MRMVMGCVALALLAACSAKPLAPKPSVPRLFPANGLYELKSEGDVTWGYIFAMTTPGEGHQTLRWLLLEDFKSPTAKPVWVTHVADPGSKGLPTTASEFAGYARDTIAAAAQADPDGCPHIVYVKSFADTFTTYYDPPGPTNGRTIAVIRAPNGRLAPDPHGTSLPPCWLDDLSKSGKFQQIDGGSVGIRPGDPPTPPSPPPTPPSPTPTPTPTPPVPLPVYYPLIGMAVAGPQAPENVEYWFIPYQLFETGLDQMWLYPFANQEANADSAPQPEWALVVVNSSYYPGYVPNQW